MKRTFAAIKVAPCNNLLKLYNEIRTALDYHAINWVAEKNIHITLKFFGDTTNQQIDAVCSLFDDIALKHNPFSFTLNGTGIFGSRYDPRVIWLGIENGWALENLALDVLNGVEEVGFPRDRQNFRPHLTIGRIKRLTDKRSFQKVIDHYSDFLIGEVRVEEFHLIESRLKPRGPEYDVIETFRL
jgi:2'-5' RNA ligase